jgi:hypothetical protein
VGIVPGECTTTGSIAATRFVLIRVAEPLQEMIGDQSYVSLLEVKTTADVIRDDDDQLPQWLDR